MKLIKKGQPLPRQEVFEPVMTRITDPVRVSLCKNRSDRPVLLRVHTTKQAVEFIDAYVSPYNKFEGFGEMPLTPQSIMNVLKKFGESEVVLDPDVEEWFRKEIFSRRDMHELLLGNDLTKVHPEAYDFQRVGINYMQATEFIPGNYQGVRVLQCDDPRLGKTMQSILSVLEPENTPAMVVCLKSLVDYWIEQIKYWRPDVRPIKIDGPMSDRIWRIRELIKMSHKDSEQFPYVIVTNWRTLLEFNKIPRRETNNIRTVIGDEAHMMRNPKTKIAKAMHSLRPRNALLLTATPLERGPQEYFSYLKFLRPWEFTSYWRYVYWFCETEHNGFGLSITGPRNISLLQDMLYPMMLRRKAEEVVDMPEKVYQKIRCEYSLEFEELYSKMRQEFLTEVINDDGEFIDLPNAVSKMTRLRQISSHPSILGFRVGGPKLPYLVELVQERFKEEKIVVFCCFNDTIKLLHKYLGDESIVFSGSHEEVQRFTNEPECRVFLTTPNKGGIGTTLGSSSIIIYYDLPLSSTLLRQSRERTTLIGKTNSQLIVTLIATPMDETVAALLQTKLDTISDTDIITAVVAAETEAQSKYDKG